MGPCEIAWCDWSGSCPSDNCGSGNRYNIYCMDPIGFYQCGTISCCPQPDEVCCTTDFRCADTSTSSKCTIECYCDGWAEDILVTLNAPLTLRARR